MTSKNSEMKPWSLPEKNAPSNICASWRRYYQKNLKSKPATLRMSYPMKNLMPLSNTPATSENWQQVEETLKAERTRRHTENRLAYYRPYKKQIEFHDTGATARERLLMAGNQLGKTLAGGFE